MSGRPAPRAPASHKLPANPAGLISASAAISRRDGQNKEDALKTPIARQKIEKARELLHDQNTDIKTICELAEELIREREFGYARRLLTQAHLKLDTNAQPEIRLRLAQRRALATYKDQDILPKERLDLAFEILRQNDDPNQTTNQETLGLAGAIQKRRWEFDGHKRHLERSLFYYLRGYEQGVTGDYGYTGINAAFVLNLQAHQEEEEAAKETGDAMAVSDDVIRRRQQAKEIRVEIAAKLTEMAERGEPDAQKWWFLVTIAEAYFGLERYDQAQEWMLRAADLKDEKGVADWECEATVRQLAQLARLQAWGMEKDYRAEGTPAWEALNDFTKRLFGNPRAGWAACESGFTGKIGLALSGGGFRAALYHIGVLARLAEIDVLRKVEVLSCVSGGSIVGAHYYLEVRRLLREKDDSEITREDYINIVERIEKDFLDGVKTNIRTRVIGGLFTNLKMIAFPHYSRTERVGELYEKKIYSKVDDGEGGKERWLNNLKIEPKDENSESFQPKNHNWRRKAKVPILILNATTLNTGHNWQFTATWMGEPPATVDSEVDGNCRLRRMYYTDAPEGYTCMRLGRAVAASSCVPGLFEPIALPNLYPSYTVRLVDGGVYDNQGTAGLLDQGCNVLLVSDATGQMGDKNDPGSGLLGVPLRSNSILQARVRVAQFRELASQHSASVLRGLMFIHLKEGLKVKPVDWINCPDPQDEDAPDNLVTGYGINKQVEQRLAAIRTDLDSFSDCEAYALMLSGYRMTEQGLPDSLRNKAFQNASRFGWRFLQIEELITKNESPRHMLDALSVAGKLAFKIFLLWLLQPWGRVLSRVIALAAAALIGWFFWGNWNQEVMKLSSTGLSISLTWGKLALTILTITAMAILPAILRNVVRVVDYQKSFQEAAIGFGLSLLGWFFAGLHLLVFDKLYLRWGSIDRMLKLKSK